ncbi:MAG: hypothetical protein ACYDCO_21925 [Armatimonadota bacterium]
MKFLLVLLALCCLLSAAATESIWLEAEQLDGIEGYCWPVAADPARRTTHGKWGLSGPGLAAEWMQGGESGFLSIACGAADDAAVATKTLDIPETGQYFVWVRYRDSREKCDRFQIRLEQAGQQPWTGTYGEKPVVDEDSSAKLYWTWAFAWDSRAATLQKGQVKLSLLSGFKEADCRQIDVIVLTNDTKYRPLIKERPQSDARDLLNQFTQGVPAGLEPLARSHGKFQAPAAWAPKTFKDRGFLYLWNTGEFQEWGDDDPAKVKFPFHIRDKETKEAFIAKYAGKDDVPIFSDPRIVPTFHGSGPWVLDLDEKNQKLRDAQAFKQWLDANPNRLFAGMLNYYPDNPISAQAANDYLTKYRDRYVGSISGEHLGYFYPSVEEMKAATAGAKTRRELAEAMRTVYMNKNVEKYRKVFGRDLPEPYRDVIPCQSNEMTMYAPLIYWWGARTSGYESAVATYGSEALSLAFLRGAARQHSGMTATYRSSNFGDSATMFSEAGNYSQPKHIHDNYYDVYAGSGPAWYKFDIWYQYMAGASLFYHEQGFDEFWTPGGQALGRQEVQLSPKGKLVDRFLRLSRTFDRGTMYTPVAFLADYAHGWTPNGNTAHLWGGHAERPDLTTYGDHNRMMQEYLFTAFHPMIPHSEKPITALSETFLPAVFGDIYDVIFAYPDMKRWATIDTYPVVIVIGDIALTAPEGQRLAQYVDNGGTLVVADGTLTGPGAAAVKLPKMGNVEDAAGYKWLNEAAVSPSQRYRFRAIPSGRALAATADGKAFCSAFDRGKGRLIVLSVPHGLGINKEAVPVVPRLLAHLSRDLMPVEVEGNVEWLLNQRKDGWTVTLINPAGEQKPQHGMFPTDYTQNKTVTIRAKVPVKAAADVLMPEDTLVVKDNTVTVTVQAGSVRIIELR